MNAPPASATTRDAAFLALVVADALKLGLPDPDYITMSPYLAGSTVTCAVSFQFNHRNGQAPLPALHAWADRFGVTVDVRTGSVHPSSTWHKFNFTFAGVLFDAYVVTETDAPEPCGAVAPHSGAVCARAAGHNGFHESGHTPAIVWERAEVAWAKEDAAAVLAASIASGQPVTVTDDEDAAVLTQCRATAFGNRCERLSGHPVPHRVEGGIEWTAACPEDDCMLDEQHPGDHEFVDMDDEPQHAASISLRIAGGAA